MAQFVVRNLEEDVAKKLKQRAKLHARSMEDEVHERVAPAQKLGTMIAQRFRRSGLRTDLAEWRGVTAIAADFDS
jgi:hypothetical protein